MDLGLKAISKFVACKEVYPLAGRQSGRSVLSETHSIRAAVNLVFEEQVLRGSLLTHVQQDHAV